MNKNSVKSAIILSLGLVVSSIIFGLSFCYRRAGIVSTVSVKGLAEREVDANIGIWPIRFKSLGGDLNQVNVEIKKQTAALVSFLKEQGFGDKEIIYGCSRLYDHGEYSKDKSLRYSLEMEIIIDSPNVFLLYETIQKSQEIIARGVFLLSGAYDLKFIFTDLNTIKSSMIQEATLNAKKAAQQLAIDSDVSLGMLRKASQGFFSIENTHVPTKKKVRVVTQMEYAIQ